MTPQPASLIVPVENQVRELDPKLLVACVAVERGFEVILGSRTRIDFRITSFPRSIYLAKGMTPKSAKMFRIMRRLGHEVAALDEEGLVYHQPEEYYARRIARETLEQITTLFAWGDDSAELLRNHPATGAVPLIVSGNPRIDLLRSELRGYFADEVRAIRERLGPYVLLNTNFSKVNAYFPRMNLLVPARTPGQKPELGAAGLGLRPEFAAGLAAHKGALFDHFRQVLPTLHAALPGHTLVVRPHPSENREPWKLVAKELPRVQVIHEGNVIPWLTACDALIHNGCTTGIEAFVMRKPALAYRPIRAAVYDLALPNELSRQCFDADQLISELRQVLSGRDPTRPTDAQRRLVDRHLAALDGPLAADRIVDVLVERAAALVQTAEPRTARKLSGWWGATQRSLVKRHIKARVPQHRNNPDYQRNRYEGVDLPELRRRVERMGRCLGRFSGVRVEPLDEHIYRLRPGAAT